MLLNATEKDIDEIVNILNDAKRRMKEDGLEQWSDEQGGYPNRETIENDVKVGQIYKYQVDNNIAGIIVINDDFYDSYPTKPSPETSRALHRVAVSNDYLGQGIGKKLYKAAEEKVKQLGYNTIIVDTYTKNQKMCGLIKTCGYIEVGEFTLFEDLPNWVMFKKEL